MIIVDTNVVSEMMRVRPCEAVTLWWSLQGKEDLCVSTVTVAELSMGIALVPTGRRKAALAASVANMRRAFDRRVLPFGEDAAALYGPIMAERRRIGRPIQPLDAMIAAIARAAGGALATRNTADFEGCGLELIDPWYTKGPLP